MIIRLINLIFYLKYDLNSVLFTLKQYSNSLSKHTDSDFFSLKDVWIVVFINSNKIGFLLVNLYTTKLIKLDMQFEM